MPGDIRARMRSKGVFRLYNTLETTGHRVKQGSWEVKLVRGFLEEAGEVSLGKEGTVSQGVLRVSSPPESKWTKHPLDTCQTSKGFSRGSVRGQLEYLQGYKGE